VRFPWQRAYREAGGPNPSAVGWARRQCDDYRPLEGGRSLLRPGHQGVEDGLRRTVTVICPARRTPDELFLLPRQWGHHPGPPATSDRTRLERRGPEDRAGGRKLDSKFLDLGESLSLFAGHHHLRGAEGHG
jgi:hypothetical protein